MKTSIKSIGTAMILALSLTFSCTPEQGEVGPKGDKGDKGDTGATGPKGDTGSQGVAGPVGAAGTNGKDGNANVIQVTFNEAFTPSTGGKTFTFPSSITTDMLNSSAVLVYVRNAGNISLFYQIPGLVLSDDFRYFFTPSARTFTVVRATGASISSISMTKVIIIPSNNNINGRVGLPNIDLSDYEAVKKYYHLKD